jgi:hypothetical protein
MCYDKVCDTNILFKPMSDEKTLNIPSEKLELSILDSLGNLIHENIKKPQVKKIFYKEMSGFLEIETKEWFDTDSFIKGEMISFSSLPDLSFQIEHIEENISLKKKSKTIVVNLPLQFFDDVNGTFLFNINPSLIVDAYVTNNNLVDTLVIEVQ